MPTELVLVVRSRLVAVSCKIIFASGTTAPVLSRTVPVTVAVACASARGGLIRQKTTPRDHRPTNHRSITLRKVPEVMTSSFSHKQAVRSIQSQFVRPELHLTEGTPIAGDTHMGEHQEMLTERLCNTDR